MNVSQTFRRLGKAFKDNDLDFFRKKKLKFKMFPLEVSAVDTDILKKSHAPRDPYTITK